MRLVETMLCGPQECGRALVVTFGKQYIVSEVNIAWEHPVVILELEE